MTRLSMFAIAATLLFAVSTHAFAAGMDMGSAKPASMSAMANYRFELAGAVKSSGAGKSVVSVRLVHVANGKPVTDAIIIQSRADMSPIGMGEMTASVKPLPSATAGLYVFEIANGAVWNKTDKWALTLSAKVQDVTQTVRGNLVVQLAP